MYSFIINDIEPVHLAKLILSTLPSKVIFLNVVREKLYLLLRSNENLVMKGNLS